MIKDIDDTVIFDSENKSSVKEVNTSEYKSNTEEINTSEDEQQNIDE